MCAALLVVAVVAVFVWARPDPPQVVHKSVNALTELEDRALRERSDFEELRAEAEGRELLRHEDHVVALAPDGVRGIDPADGSEPWSFEVPQGDPTVGVTQDGAAVVTHTVPLRWGRDTLHETVLDIDTGNVLHEEQLPVGDVPDPRLGKDELRVLTNGTVRGKSRAPGESRDHREPWEVDPADWCPGGDAPQDTSFAQDPRDLYMAVVCAESDEGALVVLSPTEGSVSWEETFTAADRAPELLELPTELRLGADNDPVVRATRGEFGPSYRFIGPGFSIYAERMEEAEGLREHVHLPDPDPAEPVTAFVIGEQDHLSAHLLHGVVGTLLDEGVLEPGDVDEYAFRDGSGSELNTMYDDMAFYSSVAQGDLLDALEPFLD